MKRVPVAPLPVHGRSLRGLSMTACRIQAGGGATARPPYALALALAHSWIRALLFSTCVPRTARPFASIAAPFADLPMAPSASPKPLPPLVTNGTILLPVQS